MSDANVYPQTGILTPLQMTAGAGLLQNQGIAPSANLLSAVNSYNSIPAISPLLNTITVGATGNILAANTLSTIETLAAANCPALSDSVPSAYAGAIPVSTNPPGFTGVLATKAALYTGSGDVSKFAQALSIAQAYSAMTASFVNSAVNSQNYLGGVFPGTNSMVTSLLTEVTEATVAFGNDLANLGQMIDLANLNDFGSPLALYRQIYTICNGVPAILTAFVGVGIDQQVVVSLTDPTVAVSDTTQRLMYTAMTKITGDDLSEVLKVFGVKTPNITTMADLLDPVKIFPNSYWTITAPVATGSANVYINQTGTVNSALATQLPPYVVSSTP